MIREKTEPLFSKHNSDEHSEKEEPKNLKMFS
jgi:hypothetical protein